MDRIPEPELMDEDEQARAYAEADFEAPHSACVDLLREKCASLPGSGVAIDLGCGPGDITFRFARAFPEWEIDGIDGAAAMLRYGQQALRRDGLADRVRLVHSYLPVDELPRAPYDFVFSNSLLHHLERPMVLWDTVKQAAAPGASVFVMDLARPESREEAERMVEEYSGSEPPILKKDFFHSLLAAYRVDEVKEQCAQAGLGLTVEMCSDRHWIAWGEVGSGDSD